MGTSLSALLSYDVTDPRSPHSVHVASEADVPDAPPWGTATLSRAVRLADGRDEVVVLDHGRGHLYLAAGEDLRYRRPAALGLGRPPALVVAGPHLLLPDGDDLAVTPFDPDRIDDPPSWPGRTGTDETQVPDASAAATDRARPPETATDGAGARPDDADTVSVGPTFDVLVPAFDIESQGTPAEPLERHTVESPTSTGTGTGTPSG